MYAESSAVLRWLLGHSDGPAVRAELEKADEVVTSALTTVEVERGLSRGLAAGTIDRLSRSTASRIYSDAAARWNVAAIDSDVLARALGPFPIEPIRALDAIHVATALVHAAKVGITLVVLSTDRRVRDNATALGLTVTP